MTNIEIYKQLSSDVERTSKKLNNFIDNNQSSLLSEIVMSLKQIPGMNKLVVIGYTPGFNDGDACTHSSNVYYNKTWHFSELAETSEIGLVYFLNVPDEFIDEPYEWEGIDQVNTYDESNEQQIIDLINILDDLCEHMHGTNYSVLIDLTPDEPTIEHKEYYCGY